MSKESSSPAHVTTGRKLDAYWAAALCKCRDVFTDVVMACTGTWSLDSSRYPRSCKQTALLLFPLKLLQFTTKDRPLGHGHGHGYGGVKVRFRLASLAVPHPASQPQRNGPRLSCHQIISDSTIVDIFCAPPNNILPSLHLHQVLHDELDKMPPARGGGRGGGRGGRGGAFNPARGTVTIAGTELNWDLTGLDIQKGPAERFPVSSLFVLYLNQPLRQQQEAPPPQAPPPTAHERGIVAHHIAVRDRIHEGPFYTILNDGMKNGLKRKANEPAPTEASLFNPFTDNQTYSAKYLKVRRRLPKLDARPYGGLVWLSTRDLA